MRKNSNYIVTPRTAKTRMASEFTLSVSVHPGIRGFIYLHIGFWNLIQVVKSNKVFGGAEVFTILPFGPLIEIWIAIQFLRHIVLFLSPLFGWKKENMFEQSLNMFKILSGKKQKQ